MRKNYLKRTAFLIASAMLVTTNFAFGQTPITIEAESGSLAGAASVENCTNCTWDPNINTSGKKVGNLDHNNSVENSATYTVNVATAGIYKLELFYIVDNNDRFFDILINGTTSIRPTIRGTGNWEDVGSTSVFIKLIAGDNTLKFYNSYWYAPNLDKLILTPFSDAILLEAENSTFGGVTEIQNNSLFSGGQGVEGNMHGLNGWITFTTNVSTAGKYMLTAAYDDATNDGDRYYKIIVNTPITTTGGKIDDIGVQFGEKKGSGGNNCTGNQTQEVDLVAGENKITFYSDWYAPRLDKIVISPKTVLPVSLTKFTAKLINKAAELNWTTASEQNSDFFAVMRSGDNQVFTKIGKIKASGNSTEIINYSFNDPSPLNGNNYYQLYQYDIDGSINKSAVKVVSTSLTLNKATLLVTGSGNSVVGLDINIPSATTGTATISNINGQTVAKQNLIFENGKSQVSIPVKGATGIYIVTVDTPEAKLRKKFFKN
ncbi:MAG TPA: T9SS type A sorting domain-containing protein [Pelobium sp.]|nr:T9SS type A sorting domain-containing protein [Pelobium sp.]